MRGGSLRAHKEGVGTSFGELVPSAYKAEQIWEGTIFADPIIDTLKATIHKFFV